MEEGDIKKQYDDLLAVYSKKRSQCQNMERQIPITKSQIQQLKAKLSQIKFTQSIKSQPELSEGEIKEKQALIKQYEDNTSILNKIELQISEDNDPQINALNAQIKSLTVTHSSFISSNPHEKVEQLTKQLQIIQKFLQSKASQKRQLQKEIENQDTINNKLIRQIKQIDLRKKSNTNIFIDPQVDILEQDLKRLEQEEKKLNEQMKKESQILEEKRSNFQEHNKTQNDQLTQLKWKNIQLQTTLEKLEAQFKYVESTTSSKQNSINQLRTLEDTQKTLNKQIDDLSKKFNVKKQQQLKKKEQSKKEKNKDKRNFKQQLIQQNTIHDLYSKELQRDKAKLQNVIKLRKSYVSQESLQILQKQYERHQRSGKSNLQVEENKREKLSRQRDTIKSRINFLNESSRQLQIQSETKLKELKHKGDELVKQKLSNEKILSESTYKLNEFMKEFPDHEKRKQQAKNEQKKRKHEAKQRVKQLQQKQRENHKKKKTESKLNTEQNDLTAWQEWNNWQKSGKLPQKDQTSFFQNRQFQLIVAAFAAIALLTLSFN